MCHFIIKVGTVMTLAILTLETTSQGIDARIEEEEGQISSINLSSSLKP